MLLGSPTEKLKRLDIQMLASLDALVSESSVSRAAIRMGMGQPAMSAILGRLRVVFGDPLLVRSSTGMVVTRRGEEIAEKARQALRLLEGAASRTAEVDPKGIALDFRIFILPSLAYSIIPGLVRFLDKEAPSIRLFAEPADLRRTREMLEADDCDMVIGYPPRLSEGLHADALFRMHLSCIARESHPQIAGTLTLDQYLGSSHAVLGSGARPVSTMESTIERALNRKRRSRNIALRTPDLLVSTAVVAESDLLATVPTILARTFSSMLRLQVLKLPFAMPVSNILMIWHERTHREPTHRFIRQLVRKVGRRLEPR